MYRELNDNEILYMIKEQDDTDYRVIFDKYEGLIYKVIHKYKYMAKKYGLEIDDLYQICSLSLIKSIKLYSDIHNTLFFTYLYRSMGNAILNELKTNMTNKQLIMNMSFSYDEIIPNTNMTYIDIIPDPKCNNFFNNLFLEEDYLYCKNSLSFDFACIFELRFNGYKNYEIATLLDLSISDIIYAIRKIKNLLDTYLVSL